MVKGLYGKLRPASPDEEASRRLTFIAWWTIASFMKRSSKPFSSTWAMRLAVWTGITLFAGSFASYSLRPDASSVLPKWLVAAGGLFLYVTGLGMLLASWIVAYRNRDGRVAWVAFLGFAVAGAMAGVVQKEPGSFFGVSVGIFSSLILALAATGTGRGRAGAWP